ncbi:YdeI/OmpD-associated family protein [Pontimicrobium sp. MEBiC06410]
MNSKIDLYLEEGCGRCELYRTPNCKVHTWKEELKLLRKFVLDCGLTEELKWGVPCYTFQKKNILIVGAFKEFCSISYLKGVLLNDIHGILQKPGESTQSARLIKFTNVQDIIEIETILKTYIYEAIEVEKAVLKVKFKKSPEPIPEELQEKMNEDPVFKTAFEALTPGRQRGYILHFSQPKQSKTRKSRIEKSTPQILNGVGLNDKYKSMKKK